MLIDILFEEEKILLKLREEIKENRALYYNTFLQYIDDFYLCFGMVYLPNLTPHNQADFWWRKDTLTALLFASQKENKFLDTYADELLKVLHKNLEQNKFTEIVCIDLHGEEAKGYKFYTKKNEIWKGTKYIKA